MDETSSPPLTEAKATNDTLILTGDFSTFSLGATAARAKSSGAVIGLWMGFETRRTRRGAEDAEEWRLRQLMVCDGH